MKEHISYSARETPSAADKQSANGEEHLFMPTPLCSACKRVLELDMATGECKRCRTKVFHVHGMASPSPYQSQDGWRVHDGYDVPAELKGKPAVPVEVVYDDGGEALIWSDETAWHDNGLYGRKRAVVSRYRIYKLAQPGERSESAK